MKDFHFQVVWNGHEVMSNQKHKVLVMKIIFFFFFCVCLLECYSDLKRNLIYNLLQYDFKLYLKKEKKEKIN